MSRVSRRRYGGGSIETATFFQQPPQEPGFRVLFAAPEPGAGPAARTVLDRLADRGLDVVTTQSRASLQSAIAGDAAAGGGGGGGRAGGAGDAGEPGRDPAPAAGGGPIGAAVLSWELFGSAGELASAIDDIQRLSAPPPVVVVSELDQEQAVPPGLAGRAAASFWLHADSPHFVADQVEWLVRTYALRSQVIGALTVAPAPRLRAGH